MQPPVHQLAPSPSCRSGLSGCQDRCFWLCRQKMGRWDMPQVPEGMRLISSHMWEVCGSMGMVSRTGVVTAGWGSHGLTGKGCVRWDRAGWDRRGAQSLQHTPVIRKRVFSKWCWDRSKQGKPYLETFRKKKAKTAKPFVLHGVWRERLHTHLIPQPRWKSWNTQGSILGSKAHLSSFHESQIWSC